MDKNHSINDKYAGNLSHCMAINLGKIPTVPLRRIQFLAPKDKFV